MVAVRFIEDQDYSAPILATAVFFLIQQLFTVNQVNAKASFEKQARAEAGANAVLAAINASPDFASRRFDYSNKYWELADRTFLNFMEQAPAFVGLLWANAFFCSAPAAGQAGLGFCAFRGLYPILWAIKAKWSLWLEISTQAGYATFSYWMVSLFYLAATGAQFRGVLPDSTFLFLLIVFLGVHGLVVLVMTLLMMTPGIGLAKLLERRFDNLENKTHEALNRPQEPISQELVSSA